MAWTQAWWCWFGVATLDGSTPSHPRPNICLSWHHHRRWPAASARCNAGLGLIALHVCRAAFCWSSAAVTRGGVPRRRGCARLARAHSLIPGATRRATANIHEGGGNTTHTTRGAASVPCGPSWQHSDHHARNARQRAARSRCLGRAASHLFNPGEAPPQRWLLLRLQSRRELRLSCLAP